jgi:hypothetical protein
MAAKALAGRDRAEEAMAAIRANMGKGARLRQQTEKECELWMQGRASRKAQVFIPHARKDMIRQTT